MFGTNHFGFQDKNATRKTYAPAQNLFVEVLRGGLIKVLGYIDEPKCVHNPVVL